MSNGPAAQEKKKGLGPLAWIAIGCAGIAILGGLGLLVSGFFVYKMEEEVAEEIEENPIAATSRLIAAANPDIELVEADEVDRVVTFRNVRTGEEFTFDFHDIEEGRLSFHSEDGAVSVELEADDADKGSLRITTEDGTASFGANVGVEGFPGWVPIYPGTSPQGMFSTETPEMRSGAYSLKTADDLSEVINYYVAALEDKGFEIVNRVVVSDTTLLTAQSSDESRTVNVTTSVEAGEVQVVVNFSEK